MDYEYITIEPNGTSQSGKTKIYGVANKRSGKQLGQIQWYGPWRQYVFFPYMGTLYSRGCLQDVASFIEEVKK